MFGWTSTQGEIRGYSARASCTRKAMVSSPPPSNNAGYHPGIKPVEPVALIKSGVDKAKTDTRVDDAGPIGPPQQPAIHLPARDRDGREQDHHWRQRGVLPEDPLPMPGLRIPPLDRAGDILRKDKAERVGGDAPDPPLRGEAAQDEAQCGRNKGADRQSSDDL